MLGSIISAETYRTTLFVDDEAGESAIIDAINERLARVGRAVDLFGDIEGREMLKMCNEKSLVFYTRGRVYLL